MYRACERVGRHISTWCQSVSSGHAHYEMPLQPHRPLLPLLLVVVGVVVVGDGPFGSFYQIIANQLLFNLIHSLTFLRKRQNK